ncbi:unnamed protein product [Paramecium primaurelia]|uniref:Uncharacterized protein n=1 Tax=Paramecium primaurelia TaxID=5886 RepID=A0A8S1MND8_PARPR|nr:unnamed protein product [Paramecium primaurelia]
MENAKVAQMENVKRVLVRMLQVLITRILNVRIFNQAMQQIVMDEQFKKVFNQLSLQNVNGISVVLTLQNVQILILNLFVKTIQPSNTHLKMEYSQLLLKMFMKESYLSKFIVL